MPKNRIDQHRMFHRKEALSPSEDSQIAVIDDVIIQVTQAFCPNGHNLVMEDKELFDGQPGICLHVSNGSITGEIILSPFHGDHVRKGNVDFEPGERLLLTCPICHAELPHLSRCSCGDGSLHLLYLTERLDEGHVIALCDVWDCHRSKVFDQAQLLSAYIEEEEQDTLDPNTEPLTFPYH